MIYRPRTADQALGDLLSALGGVLLAGATPRLFDDWQLAPDLWNVVRQEIDDRGDRGHFNLSGSSKPPSDPSRHSGAGRIGRIRMRPMSLAESGRASQEVTLAHLESGEPVTGRGWLTYREPAEAAITGGWTALLDVAPRQALQPLAAA